MSAHLKANAVERFTARFVEAHREAYAAAVTEYRAALTIQRYWRGTTVRKMIARWHGSATTIQRFYRGWLGRRLYRAQLVAVLARMERDYYDSHARTIQALWRGFYCRKHVHNYYARKAYLQAVKEKNDIVREALRKHEEELQAQREEQRAIEARRKEEANLRHTHHQLSTKVLDGVHQTAGPLEDRMRTLMRGEVRQGLLDGTLRATQHQRMATIRHNTLPATAAMDALDCTCSRTLPKPLPAVQGPFRPPPVVQQLRNRTLRQTLRTQTDFESTAQAREQEKDLEASRRIHAKQFRPFAHTLPEGYLASVRASGAYHGSGPSDTRMFYGTATFRDPASAMAPSKAFATVVPPIVFFDEA